MVNNRLVFLDIAKFFAISGVICSHAYPLGYESHNSFNYLSYGSFGVQLFFLVSGATVFLSFNRIIKKFSNPLKIFYCRNFLKLFLFPNPKNRIHKIFKKLYYILLFRKFLSFIEV